MVPTRGYPNLNAKTPLPDDFFRVLFEQAGDGVLVADAGGGILSANPSAHLLLGRPGGGFNGQILPDLVTPGQRDEFRRTLDRVCKGGPETREWLFARPDGTPVLAEAVLQRLPGNLLVGFLRGLAPRSTEEKYRHLVETSNDLIWAVDTEGRWTFVNRNAALKIYGYEPTELLGRPFADMLTPEQLQKDLAIFATIKNGMPVFNYPTVHRRKDGSFVNLNFNAIPLLGPDGSVLGTTGTATDLTERLRLESQLLQAHKMESIGRLAGGVAHDFNNLLTSILGFTELALAKGVDEERRSRYLTTVREAAGRGADLTQQLLSFARKKLIQPERVDLNQVLNRQLPLLRRLLGEDITCLLIPEEPLGTVHVDVGSLEQVLMNLAVNARDAMPRGGRLTLETRNVIRDAVPAAAPAEGAPGACVLLTVSDTGEGMSKEVLSRLFEPFFTTKPLGRGTGLGLSMCHGIVRQAGGQIQVDSEPGKGSSFKIYLPRVDGPVQPRPAAAAARSSRGHERLLVVEDDPMIRALAQETLQSLGYLLLTASDGEEALQVVEAAPEPPALMVTDVVMPRMGGRELAALLQARNPRLKVLYTSGFTENAIVHDGILQEGVNFISKPYTQAQLADQIRRTLDTVRP